MADASAPRKHVPLAARIVAGVVVLTVAVPALTAAVCGSIWVTVKLIRATGGLF